MDYQEHTTQPRAVIASEAKQSIKPQEEIGSPRRSDFSLPITPKMKEDRYAPLLKFANELGKADLLENKKNRRRQWTLEKRAERAKQNLKTKPWQHSTGPKTKAGKARSSTSAYKHGFRSVDYHEILRLLRTQAKMMKAINKATEENINLYQKNHAKKARDEQRSPP